MIVRITKPDTLIKLLKSTNTGRGRPKKNALKKEKQPEWVAQIMTRLSRGQEVMSDYVFQRILMYLIMKGIIPSAAEWSRLDRVHTDFLAYGREKRKKSQKNLQKKGKAI